jgi:hypothetical protein
MARSNRIKVDGVWYWYEYKDSWNQRYYSFDLGKTWQKSKRAAFGSAGDNRVQCEPREHVHAN